MKNSGFQDENVRLKKLIALDKTALPPDGGPRFNRLIFATSPYLLQHAENPVAWREWGEEAFAAARAEDKPVLLSIGYATCHWCHVMAHESFADPAVAAVINRCFIPIKVDREERPDLDEQYMLVSQLMTGSGGWPLNVFLTPDKEPFFAATYLPKEPRGGMPGIVDILQRLAELWRTQRQRLLEDSATVVVALRRTITSPAAAEPAPDLLLPAARQLAELYDPLWGGFGRAPKFPMPHYLMFLLRYWKRSGEQNALGMVEHTLRRMRSGGIFDQAGFGFHRYSVDRTWLVPHFEKMLYDQALIALACLETGRATGNDFYRDVAAEVFTYVLREMVTADGGFCAAQDADSEGAEGTCYLWTPAQLREVLGASAAEIAGRYFGVTPEGNFEGKTILHVAQDRERFAACAGLDPQQLTTDLEQWRSRLLASRTQRIQPLRDEKVVTAWNGLMIASLATGYHATGETAWLQAAQSCAACLRTRLVAPGGRLMRSYHLGRAEVPAFLEDYAGYVRGLLALYEATLDPLPLAEALRLSREMLALFGGEGGGALRETGHDAERLLVPDWQASDGVIPSGNAMAALNLLQLGRITEDTDLTAAGTAILHALRGRAEQQPLGYLFLLIAQDFAEGPQVEITLAGRRASPESTAMLRVIGRRFIPGLVLRFQEEKRRTGGAQTTAAICTAKRCLPPGTDADELGKLLDELGFSR